MAKISLRAYLHEIENLIDRGELDQAQLHCKQILSIYPKNIDTYRLMGKSFLEGQKYKEAEDIFQRVLSVIPDDFISHVGLSIINEEAGKLDAAIWHMERAYEVQPSNIPIMNEVKRLYAKRDGVEPAKVRLTRGALVRMYARTKLVPQAIAETRAALEENPNRTDLELILARMYLLSGQKVEASEICTKIISRSPYCLEANKILAEILPETSRADEAKNVIERVNSLDPYAAYVSQNAPTSDLVPDNTIMLEHLSEGGQPAISPFPEENIMAEDKAAQPEWLDKAASPVRSPTSPFSVPIPESEEPAQPSDQMPDWMKDAGWEKSETPEVASPPPLPEEKIEPVLETSSESAVPADIPDWLKDLQSQNPAPEVTQPPIEENTPAPFFEGQKVVETPLQPKAAASSDIPDWLGLTEEKPVEQVSPLIEESITPEIAAEPSKLEDAEVPEWLKDLNPQSQMEKPAAENLLTEPTVQPLYETSNEPVVGSIESSKSAEMTLEPAETPEPAGAEIPKDWIEDAGVAATGRTGPLIPAADIPEWLKEIEINPEGEERLKTPESTSEPEPAGMPDWLRDLQEAGTENQASASGEKEPRLPDVVPEPTTAATKPEAMQTNNPDLQQWLSSLENETGTVREAAEPIEPKQPAVESVVEQGLPVFHEEPASIPQPAAPVEKTPTTPLVPQAGIKEGVLDFESARGYLQGNDLNHSVPIFNKLIKSGHLVDEIITELKTYSVRYSSDPMLWQLIGDAYARRNLLREALDSYNRAEKLLS